MRSIPAAMRTKLLNRIKAASTESEPHIRVVATQPLANMLLTEPIHEDITAAFGDVTMRQIEGETEISLAYAVCVDEGIATVYRRRFPATVDYEWEQLFEFSPASDAAIEFDGEWVMGLDREWYYLQTEEYPYIFTVENGDLYVQKWQDTSTRILLAERVSQISACRGWASSINPDADQGLIIGYIRDGEVFYRTLAYQSLIGEKVWERENQVLSLGSNNSFLSVIRTNDFRIGFMTEQNGQIRMALTKRTYPGMSVKPEYINLESRATFSYLPISRKYGYETERASVRTQKTFFLFDEGDHRITITGAERLFSEDSGGNEYCSGVILYLNKALNGSIPAAFVSGCTVSDNKLTVTGVSYDTGRQALILSLGWKSGHTPDKHPTTFSVSFPTCFDLTYEPLPGQVWYLETQTAELGQNLNKKYGYTHESISVASEADFAYVDARFFHTFTRDGVSVSTDVEFSYLPVGDIPV